MPRYHSFQLIEEAERVRRDEAEWRQRNAPAVEAFERAHATELKLLAERRADVVPFRPVRKREEPPRRPLPPAQPAQPLKPAALGALLRDAISSGRTARTPPAPLPPSTRLPTWRQS